MYRIFFWNVRSLLQRTEDSDCSRDIAPDRLES